MWPNFKNILKKLLELVRLAPVSLAAKCRLAFGAAAGVTLVLSLLIPYIWMGQLTKKTLLDAGRAKSDELLRSHFQMINPGQGALSPLSNTGVVLDPNESEIRWIRFANQSDAQIPQISKRQNQWIDSLKSEHEKDDDIFYSQRRHKSYSNYVRIFRANDNCISCHNPQGAAVAFNKNESIGAVIIQRPLAELSRTIWLNRVWIFVAFIIAGTGAIVAFYVITQRVILRPVRQLRAMANNVAEGNFDVRSGIKTGDEYEKLANAFNHMLDSLEASQEKLRQANKQLDDKIVELSDRNIELFRANKVKGEFLANISHEFRTPLNAILGFAEILREKGSVLKEEKGRKYAEHIIAGGQNLLKMVNDLLDLAKTEAGKMKMHIESTSIQEICRGIVAPFAAITRKNKIKVRLIIDDNIPPLSTDAGKVRQIIYNFLSNAVKFTPERGRIEIRASMRDDKTVRIAVSDTGSGIAEDDKEKIFEKFRQADGSLTRESTGSGLGLAISKELATLLAGSVGLESEVGKGSTFWVDIPVISTADEREQPAQTSGPQI
jgi:two-component system sensor histidine kinase BarA